MDEVRLPEVKEQRYENAIVGLDGISYQRCTFVNCTLVYRGGPARMVSCSIGAGCKWQFEDHAAFVMQTLGELGWKLDPPGQLSRL